MRLGIYLDLRNPPPWRRDPSRVHAFALELAEEADRLGADSVWVAEHHLFEDGYLTQPLTFLAAVAARTGRVRLGTALMLAPLRRAVEIAEQAALVDLVSGGRTATFARVRQLRELWESGTLTPAPVQHRIPIWLGLQAAKGARRVGEAGECLLTLDPSLVEPYRAGLTGSGHDQRYGRMSGPVSGFITDDPERDWPVVAVHLAYEQNSYRRYLAEGDGGGPPRPIEPDRYRDRGLGFRMGNFMLATPAQAAAQLRQTGYGRCSRRADQKRIGDAPSKLEAELR
jgi:alkanesulfonate monooxygenase SsuD/methylene tetrahydromethanopterin reductase-like flavin-dependent oxidoreductase (luciferase family)